MVGCSNCFGAYSADVNLRNVLAGNGTYVFANDGSTTTFRGQNLTIDNFSHLRGGYYSPTVYLTNTLLANISDTSSYSGASNAVVSTSAFQTVGASAHYLAQNSPYRNAGTTNINSTLLAELRKRTTYPPVVLPNAITLDTTLYPQAQRDTDLPDLGYVRPSRPPHDHHARREHDHIDFDFRRPIVERVFQRTGRHQRLRLAPSPNCRGLQRLRGHAHGLRLRCGFTPLIREQRCKQRDLLLPCKFALVQPGYV
jgi:hypothetical protein